MQCFGNETALTECVHTKELNCQPTQGAGVICQDDGGNIFKDICCVTYEG